MIVKTRKRIEAADNNIPPGTIIHVINDVSKYKPGLKTQGNNHVLNDVCLKPEWVLSLNKKQRKKAQHFINININTSID